MSIWYQRYKLPLITLLVEAGPLMIFFVASAYVPFFEAVGVLSISLLVSLMLSRLLIGRLPWFSLVGGLWFAVFGFLSIYFNNSDIFILQDTFVNAFLGGVLLLTAYTSRPVLKFFFEGAFAITDEGWRVLSLRWGVLFLILAVLNEVFRLGFEPEVWVAFKAVSVVFIVCFGLYQFTLSRRERIPEYSDSWGLRTKEG